MKTIQITIDEPLLTRLDCLLEKEHGARSAFIREAVDRALFAREEAERERQHREGYLRHPQTADEFDWPIDTDYWENS